MQIRNITLVIFMGLLSTIFLGCAGTSTEVKKPISEIVQDKDSAYISSKVKLIS